MRNIYLIKFNSLVQFNCWLIVATALSACSPKIYVIDNQTVLEEEAAGSWPLFEKQVLDKAKAKGPTPLSQVPPNETRNRLYNVLNGEMPIVATESIKTGVVK